MQQIELNLRAEALNIRKAALDELATLPASVAVPILQKLAQEKDFALRRIAVMGLGNHRTQESFAALQGILFQEKDANVLSEAANSIFEFGNAAIPELHELFERCDNWLVRQTVVSLLMETDNFEVLFAVASAAVTDTVESVRSTGVLALGKLLMCKFRDPAFELLIQMSQDPEWTTRCRVADAVCVSYDPRAMMLISKLQQDENYRVVAAALSAAANRYKY
ncbi:MAG: HEAT repeat domain-containing protein [Calothrix sp. SM1_7_51]|nr:HEAT repeat domain-containing protein [Calothrix sp. SM1_7_51]